MLIGGKCTAAEVTMPNPQPKPEPRRPWPLLKAPAPKSADRDLSRSLISRYGRDPAKGRSKEGRAMRSFSMKMR